jgi:hypothetical protein
MPNWDHGRDQSSPGITPLVRKLDASNVGQESFTSIGDTMMASMPRERSLEHALGNQIGIIA